MTESMTVELKKLLVQHEGYRNFPYFDTNGNITIGIGYNLSARGLPDQWINDQYNQDVNYFYNQLNDDFPWFKELCEARQMVLIDMCFMGYKTFKGFKKMLEALSRHDYRKAAEEMLDSKWAQDVKGRAMRLHNIMRAGELKWAS